MGMDIGCALVVGLKGSEIGFDVHDFYQKYELTLEQISPWYDCDFEYRIIGITIAKSWDGKREIDPYALETQIDIVKKKFLNLTGKEAKVYISPNVT